LKREITSTEEDEGSEEIPKRRGKEEEEIPKI
jgi:hypothetical protein